MEPTSSGTQVPRENIGLAVLQRRFLFILLPLYAFIQLLYLSATPLQGIELPDNLPQNRSQKLLVGIGPDEKEHFLYVLSLAEQGRLPRQTPRHRTAPDQYVSYEIQHPPLFYALAALVFKILSPLGLPFVWYALRVIGSMLGFLVVLFSARAALVAFPDRPLVVLGTPACIALLPIFGHMNSVLSNEPLGAVLGAWAWFQAVRLIRQERAPTIRDAALLGVTLGVGMWTRSTVLLWLPATLLLILVAARRHQLGVGLPAVVLGCFLALALPWFLYLKVTYGTPLLRSHYYPLLDNIGLLEYLRKAEDLVLYLHGLPQPRPVPLRIVLSAISSTSWAPFWLIAPIQGPVGGILHPLFFVLPFIVVILLFLHSSRQGKKPVTERENDPVGRALVWAAFSAVLFANTAVLYQIFYVDWSIINYAGRYLVSSAPAAALLLTFAVSTLPVLHHETHGVKRQRALAITFTVLMFFFALWSALLVRRFYKENPEQPSVQPIVEARVRETCC